MACDCCVDASKCNGLIYSSECVKYGGDNIPSLLISKGDSMSCVVNNISKKLTDLSIAKDVFVPDVNVDKCGDIKSLLGNGDKTLINLLQALVDNQCILSSKITVPEEDPSYSFDKKCLVVPNNADIEDFIQATIDLSCKNSTDITSLKSTVSTNSQSIANIEDEIANIKAPNTPIFTFSQLMPPYVPMPYIGDISNFDTSGKGISEKGYDGIYIMNGNNGTQDWRGYSPIGATSGVPGPALDTRVNPSIAGGPTIAQGTKVGEVMHTITVTEMASHSHTVNDPGHFHAYIGSDLTAHPSGGSTTAVRHQETKNTAPAKTNITINTSGGGKAHNNLQPSVGVIWIVKLP